MARIRLYHQDLNMMNLLNSKERTLPEFIDLGCVFTLWLALSVLLIYINSLGRKVVLSLKNSGIQARQDLSSSALLNSKYY